jgi:hypothetical protein
MFCFPGQKIDFPSEALDKSGVPLVNPIMVIQDIENPDSFKPFNVLVTGTKKYTCLICNCCQAGNGQEGNHFNAISHVRKYHLEYFPINCWSEEGAKKLQDDWLKKLTKAQNDANQKSKLVQTKVSFASRPVSDQVKAWTRAVCLGQTIPMSVETNLGTSSLIKFYNNGIQPRGLSYSSIKFL